MRVIPAIDLKAGRCVRLVEGLKDSAKIYDGDPVEIARAYQRAGADLIHLVDLDAAFPDEQSDNRKIIRRISAELDIPVEVGGGIRSHADVDRLIEETGVRYVVLGTLAVEHPEVAADAVRKHGDSIVIGIDARFGKVATRGWTVQSDVSVDSMVLMMAGVGVGRFIYTDILRDGRLAGPDLEMTGHIAKISGRLVTASGGVSSLQDINRLCALEPLGVDSVIVGKALYEGRFTLEQAISAGNGRGPDAG
jgi:phosphoribosylformimino-5-aminoimidazole carboxamide ribotide isomerase